MIISAKIWKYCMKIKRYLRVLAFMFCVSGSLGSYGVVLPNTSQDVIAVENATDGSVVIGPERIELGQDALQERYNIIGIRFNDVPLERDAKVNKASIQLQAAAAGEGRCRLTILGVYDGDAKPWLSQKRNISSRKATLEQVDWEVSVWKKAGEAGTAQQTPDLADIVNEILGHPKWERGHSLMFILAGEGVRAAQMGVGAIELHLEGDSPAFVQRDYTVMREADCAEEAVDGGDVSLYSSDLELGSDEGRKQIVGLRFAGVELGSDETVVEATIQFQCDETRGSDKECRVVIAAEKAGNAAVFRSERRNLSARVLTSTWMEWVIPAWQEVHERDAGQRSPDLGDIIREIIRQPDWQPGQAIAFLIDGEGQRCAESYRSSRGRPVLTITTSRLDHLVSFTADELTLTESDDVVRLAVRLNRACPEALRVPFDVRFLSADADDIAEILPADELVIPARQREGYIELRLRDDMVFEKDEEFTITLKEPVPAGGMSGVGLGLHQELMCRVKANDFPPETRLAPTLIWSDESKELVRVGVTLSEPAPQAITVDYELWHDSTTAADFSGTVSGRVRFAPGEQTKTIVLQLVDDAIKEDVETARLILSSPQGGNEYGTARLMAAECAIHISASDYPPDWPMYRFDAGRSGASPVSLPEKLALQWVLELPRLKPAWDEQDPSEDLSGDYERRFTYDRAYAPVIVDERMFVGSSYDDSVRACNTETGKELWRFYASGPVRFAPAVHHGRLYFSSDDGFVYCLAAADGKELWRFRAAPTSCKVIGNHRLISAWPSRGGVCLTQDDRLYVTAGIFPFMGTFIYELDPQTGKVRWCNDGSGSLFMYQPHATTAKSFSAVAPQGYLAAAGDYLLTPNGRACPAGFKRSDGEFLYMRYGDRINKGSESRNHVAAFGSYFQQGGKLLHIADGSYYGSCADGAVLAPQGYYHGLHDRVEFRSWDKELVWSCPLEQPRTMIKAGKRIYVGVDNGIVALNEAGKRLWQQRCPGRPIHLAAGAGKLLVAVEEGPVYCFGERENPAIELPDTTLVEQGATWRYLDDGSDQGTVWRGLDFDDSRWAAGPAVLGYGNGDDATVISFGEDKSNKHVTNYFRHAFIADDDVEKISELQLRVFRDDGAIVYLNGREIMRTHMPREQVNYRSYALGGEGWVEKVCDPCYLRRGKNVLAVEVHQCSPTSSDVSFDLELTCVFGRHEQPVLWPAEDAFTDLTRQMIEMTGQREGYCLVWGIGNGRLMEELARQSRLLVIGMDPDAQKVEALRRRWDGMNLPRERVNALAVERFGDVGLPAYLANLIVIGDEQLSLPDVKAIYRSLRPYGGTFCMRASSGAATDEMVSEEEMPQAVLTTAKDARGAKWTLLRREGALPGAADWTHNYGDTAQTSMSQDKRVKLPLGLLHFGNTSNRGVLPRHGHGPTELVAGGRVFIEGVHFLRAFDVYTGRLMWQKDLPGVGYFFRHTTHEAGANAIGSNYAVTDDDVYVVYEGNILRLDAATGATRETFSIPELTFSQVRVYGDYLVCAANPMTFDRGTIGTSDTWNWTCSRDLLTLNRFRGERVWHRQAENAFHHNTIIIGSNDTVYCIDRIPPDVVNMLERRGEDVASRAYTLWALEVDTGKERWHITDPTRRDKVFGTWLAYHETYDILVQSFRKSRDMVRGEPFGRLMTLRGEDGTILMEKETPAGAEAPFVLYHHMVICQGERSHYGSAFDIRTGEPIQVDHPLTGELVDWTWTRAHGCNSAIACDHLLTFRSGAAGFYDMSNFGGSGNFGGFKSGCTPSLVPANGVLNYPEYTRTCVCAYQNQTSLALVYMPEVEIWTFSTWPNPDPTRPVRRLGLNFGAYGDRRVDDGTLWMEYPVSDVHKTGFNTSPRVGIEVEPTDVLVFRHHSARYPDSPMGWVFSSGIEGVKRLRLQLGNAEPPRNYTVRLYFSLPEVRRNLSRVFDVSVQGRSVEQGLRLTRGEDGRPPLLRREYKNVKVARELDIALDPVEGLTVLCGVEVEMEMDKK